MDSFSTFIAAGARHGLSHTSAMCVYGLAEATLAVSFSPLDIGIEFDQPELRETGDEKDGRIYPSYKFALVGMPLEGTQVRIGSSLTKPAIDRAVGEIQIRGDSVTPGYLHDSDLGAEEWLSTGDLGYFQDGQLVICGRTKELIIIAGRNVLPDHIESVICKAAGARAGSVVAFGVKGRTSESAAAVVEVPDLRRNSNQLRRLIRDRVLAECNVSLSTIRLVEVGTLPKTSSGKISRVRTQQMFNEGLLS